MQHPLAQHVPVSEHVTVFIAHWCVDISHDETGHCRPMAWTMVPPPPRQSRSLQHAPHTPLQQIGVEPPHAGLLRHLCVPRSQLSVVHALLSSQSESLRHWMQPPFAGSQLKPLPHAALFGECEHLPPEQVSLVQAIKSSQSASAQQALQPLPCAQHLPPFAQVAPYLQLPPTQLPAPEHGSVAGQSSSFKHCAVCTQP